MKVWELEEGKEYICRHNNRKYKVVDEILFVDDVLQGLWVATDIGYNTIVRCDFTEYIPHTDWSKVEVDTKVLVRDGETEGWYRRYFAKYEDGKFYAWENGVTSFTVDNNDEVLAWNQMKLYKEE